MAFNVAERFPPPPPSYKLLDPGSYQKADDHKVLVNNKAPFLSRTPRKTQPGGCIWTHAIYDPVTSHKIPNITSMTSKLPRFPYEAFSKEDLEALLCRCGIQIPCECPTEDEEEKEIICQAKVHRRIFKGPGPKCTLGEGLSTPSKRDHGFEILPDGSQKRMLDKASDESPPFYDATVHESTAFYRGCKWSQWTSKRSLKSLEERPGPADYSIEKQLTDFEICAEKFRSYRRQTSKQLRFIESVQQRNIIEGRPGPATYSPELPRGYEIETLGSKSKRFTISSKEQRPGPADHFIKRAFDLPEPPQKFCLAKLPEPSFFGIKAQRFKPRREEGPSPATYSVNYDRCHIMHCPKVPFGSSSERFKTDQLDDDEEESELIAEDEPKQKDDKALHQKDCPSPSWEFKSKTIRMKPLEKRIDEPSPADLPQTRTKVHRLQRLQQIAPFFSSEGRFQPWYDWMPVFGRLKTPGPCYYCLEKPKCYPAVRCGPLYRARRFTPSKTDNPPPNRYNLGGGVETILATHNKKLRDNIDNKHKFTWVPPIEPQKLSFEEQESILWQKSIALLNTDSNDNISKKSSSSDITKRNGKDSKPKQLRCFIYGSQTPHC